MPNGTWLLSVSRPRFWTYLAGPFVVGVAASAPALPVFASPTFLAWLLFFLIPANLLLYGINDLCDQDTDAHNQKKGTKEVRLLQSLQKRLYTAVWGCLALAGVLVFVTAPPIRSLLALAGFCILAVVYSSPPLRLKAKPFVDAAANILYILPGLFGYALYADAYPSVLTLVALGCWTGAMQIFSAIPDISADKEADLLTTAVVLGENGALRLCALLWAIFAIVMILASPVLGWIACIYPFIPILLLNRSTQEVEQAYWAFPRMTALLGMIAFLAILLSRL